MSFELEYEKTINNILNHTEEIDKDSITYPVGEDDEFSKAEQTTLYDNKQDIIENKVENTNKKNIITLKSYYKKRTDYGDITSSFYKVYEREFCNYYEGAWRQGP